MSVHKILMATDFSEAAKGAGEFAALLARDLKARLLIVHVKPSPEIMGADEGDVADPTELPEHKQLEQITPTSGVDFEHHFLHGRPSDSILHLAEKEIVDMIVIGTHGETNSPDQLIGSVAQAIIGGAQCAVLSLKPAIGGGSDR